LVGPVGLEPTTRGEIGGLSEAVSSRLAAAFHA
jgi:hypothetical protein